VHQDGWPVPDTWDFEHTLLHPEVDAGKGTRSFVYGESLHDWQMAILEMRQIAELWEWVRRGQNDRLSRHIRWQRPNEIVYDSNPDLSPDGFAGEHAFVREHEDGVCLHTREYIASSTGEHWQLLKSIPEGDCARAAIVYLQRKVSAHLCQDIVPDILPRRNHPERLDLGLRPRTLISGLWLQLAYGIAEHRYYRRCAQCNRWFETSEARSNRVYCAEASVCRNLAYRQRKERAREMYRNGLSAMAIAKEVGSSTPTTVEKWLAAGSEPKRPRGRPRKET
jgi:hypothetical protein